LFNVFKRQELVTYQFAQFFTELLLPFWKNALDGKAEKFIWFAGMKHHFYGNPIGKIPDERRNNWDQEQAKLHMSGLGVAKITFEEAYR
jgi:hypothetical protein